MTIELHCDNQSAIKIAKNPVSFQRSKHFDIKLHFIRDEILTGNVKPHYCPTEEMEADLLTKSISKIQFQKLRNLINIKEIIEGE